jgi:hypothetical protein
MGLFEERLARRMTDPKFAAAHFAADREIRFGHYAVESNIELFELPVPGMVSGYFINTPVLGVAAAVLTPTLSGPSLKQVATGALA